MFFELPLFEHIYRANDDDDKLVLQSIVIAIVDFKCPKLTFAVVVVVVDVVVTKFI